MNAPVVCLDHAHAWRAEFGAQADQLQHAAGQLVDQLRTEGKHREAASVIESANVALSALGSLQRLGAKVTGIRRGMD